MYAEFISMFMPSFLQVSTRGDTVYTFSSIEKDEYSRLYDFFKAKKIAVKTVSINRISIASGEQIMMIFFLNSMHI